MRSGKLVWTVSVVLGVALGLVACGGGQEAEKAAADTQAWTELQTMKSDLDGKRQELDGLWQQIEERAAAPAAEPADDDAAGDDTAGEEPATIEDLEAKAEALSNEINTQTEALGERLATFINSQDIYEGEELTDVQKAAFQMNSAERIVVAREYIDRGGDYQRAIDIYRDAQQFDPDNQDLKDAIAWAEEMRYMTEERFAQVTKDMAQNEVRKLLGQPNLRNIRDYEDDGVVAWFYPRGESGAAGAAGVFFKESKAGAGDWAVYNLDFEAKKAEVSDEGTEAP